MKGVVWKGRGSLLAHRSVISVEESGAAKHVARPQVHPKHTHSCECIHIPHTYYNIYHISLHTPPHSRECIHTPHTYYKYIHTHQHIPLHTPPTFMWVYTYRTYILQICTTVYTYTHTNTYPYTLSILTHTFMWVYTHPTHILHVHTHTPAYILTHSPHRHTSTTPHHTISRTRLSSSCQNDLLLGSWKDCVWWDGIGWNGPGSPRILFIKMKARHMDQIRAQ